jgi:hypothetical protein
VLSIKYSLKDLVGVCMPDTIGAHYDFLTQVNGVTVDKDPDGIQIGKRYGPPPPPPVPTPAPGDTVILIPNIPRHGAVLGATAQAVDLPLYRPMPNPFSDGMHMAYAVGPEGARVRISVYDVSGRRVRSMADGEQAPGSHLVAWDGRDDQGMRMRGGVYFVHAQVGRDVKQVRVMFLK